MGDYLCNNFNFPQQGEGTAAGKSVRQALISYLTQLKELVNPPLTQLPIIRKTTFSL